MLRKILLVWSGFICAYFAEYLPIVDIMRKGFFCDGSDGVCSFSGPIFILWHIDDCGFKAGLA